MKPTLLLFIHGLGGDGRKTWGNFPSLISQDSGLSTLIDVDFYNYPTTLWRFPLSRKTPRIQTLASGLRTQIDNRYTDYSSIILVCHSLGGLVARYYLTEEIKNSRTPKAGRLLLYAVPNNGTALASIAKYVSWQHHQLRQLCRDSDLLDYLNEDWRREKIGEKVEVKYVVAGLDRVVEEPSAKSFWGNQNVETIVDKGHINVVKPERADDLAFIVLRRFVLSAKPQTPTEPVDKSLTIQARDQRSIWNIPFHRNPNFTGQAELLADLRAALTKDKTAALTQAQAIHGLGGVGKTQLALEYAYRFAAEFQIAWWLRAEEPATLATDFSAMATALELPEKEAKDQTAIIQAVRQWLNHHTGWLMIFDNAQQPQDLLPYLPQLVSGQVIITSRNPQWKGVANALKVREWPPAESVAFLLRRSGNKDEQAANTVAHELGHLPLALEQAGAYVEATCISLAEYLVLFRQLRADLLKEHRPLEYPDTVATTWEMAFQKLKAEIPMAVELLSALAFLAPDNIPRSLLVDGRKHLPKKLSKALSKPLETNRAIASLARYSLIEASNESFSLHRLVQAVTRDRMPTKLKKTWATALVKLMADAYTHGEKDPADVRHWSACEALLSHALSAAEHAEKYNVALEQVAILFHQTGLYLQSRAQYAPAKPLYRRSLEICEKQFGRDHPIVATVLSNQAGLLHDEGQYAAAESLYRRSLDIWEKQLGRDHPKVATGLNKLAASLSAQGQYAVAEPLVRRSLEIGEKQLGQDHSDVAVSMNSLAELLHVQGQYAAAEPLYRRSLEICEKQLGRDYPNVAAALSSLARLLFDQGQDAAAEPLYRRSLEIAEKACGPEHPDVAMALNNLAMLLKAEGQYAAAEPLCRRSLEILEKQLGRDHPKVALTLNNLAALLENQGQYSAAEPLFRRILAIREKQLGPDHPDVATGLHNLAALLENQGQYSAAEPLFRRSVEIREKQLGPNHPDVAQGLNSLAGLLVAQGQYAAAEPLLRRSLEILEKSLGPDHPNTRTVRENLALLQENLP